MKNNKKLVGKIIGIVAAVVVVLLVAADLLIANYLCNYALSRAGDGGNRKVTASVPAPATEAEKKIAENRKIQYAKNDAWLEAVPTMETTIKSDDGLALKGFYWLQENVSDKWVIAIHGYRSNHREMISAGENFYGKGFNVLTPDLRACGESEGQYVGMGWLDRKDILCWVNWIISQNPESKIVIMGESMGGATTMMVSGEQTPDNVVAFVEDCGYSRVWDIFADELGLRFHLPTFPILDTASGFAKLRAGYSFREASSIKQLKKSTKPMLFIHGTVDNFVTYPNFGRVYAAKADNKEQFIVEDAGHVQSAYLARDQYYKTVFEFLDKYL